jgi:hypothetical protein
MAPNEGFGPDGIPKPKIQRDPSPPKNETLYVVRLCAGNRSPNWFGNFAEEPGAHRVPQQSCQTTAYCGEGAPWCSRCSAPLRSTRCC